MACMRMEIQQLESVTVMLSSSRLKLLAKRSYFYAYFRFKELAFVLVKRKKSCKTLVWLKPQLLNSGLPVVSVGCETVSAAFQLWERKSVEAVQ